MSPSAAPAIGTTAALPGDPAGPPAAPKSARKLNPWLIRLGSLVVVLGAWQAIGSAVNPIFLSTPWRIVLAMVDLIVSGKLGQAMEISVVGIAIGFAGAVIIGVPLGILMARSSFWNVALDPYINGLYVTPRVALIPLLIIWFGIGFQAQVLIIFLSSVFPIIVNSYAGVRDISRNWVDTAQSFCATERQLFFEVILPASVPFVMTGLRLGIGQAVVGMIVGQMFLALAGLGKLLVNYGDFFKTDYVFAVVIATAVLGLILTEAVKAIERRFAHWKESERAFI